MKGTSSYLIHKYNIWSIYVIHIIWHNLYNSVSCYHSKERQSYCICNHICNQRKRNLRKFFSLPVTHAKAGFFKFKHEICITWKHEAPNLFNNKKSLLNMQYLIFEANKSKILIHSYFIIKEERNSIIRDHP